MNQQSTQGSLHERRDRTADTQAPEPESRDIAEEAGSGIADLSPSARDRAAGLTDPNSESDDDDVETSITHGSLGGPGNDQRGGERSEALGGDRTGAATPTHVEDADDFSGKAGNEKP